MKLLALALLAFTSLAQAGELDATEAMVRTLPPGIYTGFTPQSSEACSIEVRQIPQGILVIALKAQEQVTRSVGYGTVYRWNPGQRLFLSSDHFSREDVSEEVAFRTIAIDEDTQFAVVSHTRTMGRDRVFKQEIACEVKL